MLVFFVIYKPKGQRPKGSIPRTILVFRSLIQFSRFVDELEDYHQLNVCTTLVTEDEVAGIKATLKTPVTHY